MIEISVAPSNASVSAICPICGGRSRPLFCKYTHWILACQSCEHQWTEIEDSASHVDRVYGNSYFEGGGAGYPNYLNESDLLRQHGRRYAKLLSHYREPGEILDVGAAAGFILQGFVDSGWKGKGIEPNQKMAHFAATQLKLEVEPGTLEKLKDGKTYDVISMIQVVAHFYDIQQAFKIASLQTKPGGYWLIESWNRDSWMARIFGQNWHEYSPPSVLHWFTPNGISLLAAQQGFEEVARGRPSKWIKGSHIKSLLRYKLADLAFGKSLSELLEVIPDQISVPYPAEDLFWILLKKS